MSIRSSRVALALSVFSGLSAAALAQAPAIVLPPPPVTPPPAITYYSGPGVVYFGSPRHSFYGAASLPSTVYPPGYSYNVGPVGTYVGFGLFRPRGVRTYYRPGFVGAPYPAP
jgi:hypothetical protein